VEGLVLLKAISGKLVQPPRSPVIIRKQNIELKITLLTLKFIFTYPANYVTFFRYMLTDTRTQGKYKCRKYPTKEYDKLEVLTT